RNLFGDCWHFSRSSPSFRRWTHSSSNLSSSAVEVAVCAGVVVVVCACAAAAGPSTTAVAKSPTATRRDRNVIAGLRSAGDEEEHGPEQGERLPDSRAQEHRGAHHAGGLGLTGHGLDGVPDEEADADAG